MEGTPHSPPLKALRPRRKPLPANPVPRNFPHGVPSMVIATPTGAGMDVSTPRRMSSASLLLRRRTKGREAPTDKPSPRKVPHSFLFTPVGPANKWASTGKKVKGGTKKGGTQGGRVKPGLGAFAFSSSKKQSRVSPADATGSCSPMKGRGKEGPGPGGKESGGSSSRPKRSFNQTSTGPTSSTSPKGRYVAGAPLVLPILAHMHTWRLYSCFGKSRSRPPPAFPLRSVFHAELESCVGNSVLPYPTPPSLALSRPPFGGPHAPTSHTFSLPPPPLHLLISSTLLCHRLPSDPNCITVHTLRTHRDRENEAPAVEMKQMATLYPMLVMTMDTFLGLDTLLPHQNMLKDKRLLPYNPETMDNRVLFVSHQWTSFGEADHTGIQIQTLQRVLRRLMAGSISKVATNWQQRVTLGTNEVVTAAQWKMALPHMFVWVRLLSPTPHTYLLQL